MNEGRIIVDRYDLPASMKHLTRQYRQGNNVPVAHHITDTTHIANVQIRTILGHVNTKMQLTEYFAKRTLEMALAEEHPVVVTWSSECTATYTDKSYMRSDHDEKYTELILHAADATRSGAKSINIRKSFKCANGQVLLHWTAFGASAMPIQETFAPIEQFICQLDLEQQTSISRVAKLRWWLFKKKQATSRDCRLLQAACPRPVVKLLVCDYGWQLKNNEWAPVMTPELPAPESVRHQ